MREYDDQVRPYVMLRRIIIVVAVLTAIPVALWTVTAFVRAYVGPPKLPTFRQLVTTAGEQQESTGATTTAGAADDRSLWQTATTFVRAHLAAPQIPSVRQLTAALTGNANARSEASNGASPGAEQVKPAGAPPMTVEARATATDARDQPASTKETQTNDTNMPASATKMTDASPASITANSADTSVTPPANARTADVSASSKPEAAAANAWPTPSPQNATQQTPAPWPSAPQSAAMQQAAQETAKEQTAAAVESPADVMPAGQPLSGRIPLPRHRPSDLTMVRITAANVPMPRPRPDIHNVAASSETTTGPGPLNFLNNLFH